MEKLKINMVGGGFQHDISASTGAVPKYIEWDKTGSSDISIHLDFGMVHIPTNKSKRNFAWILEAASIQPHLMGWVRNNIPYLEENFELIFTYDKRLVGLSDKIRFVPLNSNPWVKDIKIHDKSKLVSMIASIKTMCPAQTFLLTETELRSTAHPKTKSI